MYFCEDHGSASDDDDDGRGTVRHFSGAPASATADEAGAKPKPSKSTLAPLSLFQEAEATRSYSAPSSPRPTPAGPSGTAATAAAAAAAGAAASTSAVPSGSAAASRRQRNASLSSQQPQRAVELSPQPLQRKYQHQPGRTPSSASSASPPPPPYPEQQQQQQQQQLSSPGILASASASATGPPFLTVNGGGNHDGFVLSQATTAFQEVREISLGRHNEEPYGMKVESIGEAFHITHVVRNSVAACAGLKVGDEIVRINDRRLEGLKTRDVLQIIRQSDVCVKLAFKPRAVVARIREVRLKKDNGVLGLRLQKKPDGLYIDFVKAGTVAHSAGLKDGDQVLKINSHIVTDWSMEGAMALLKSLSESEPLQLLIRETLPLTSVASGSSQPSHYQPTVAEGNGPFHQQQPLQPQFRRQCSATTTTAGTHQNGAIADGCGPSERTASCSRLGDASDSGGGGGPGDGEGDGVCGGGGGGGGGSVSGGAVVRRALGTNPCASTDDLEITRLPMELDNPRGAAGSAASGSATSFLKSSRLTSFLKSARFSRHPSPRQAAALAAASGRDRGSS